MESEAILNNIISNITNRDFRIALNEIDGNLRNLNIKNDIESYLFLMRHKGICHFELSEIENAIKCFEICLGEAQKAKIDREIVNAHHELSLVFTKKKEFNKAINAQKESIRLLTSSKSLNGIEVQGGKENVIAQTAYSLAINYMELNKLDEAEKSLLLAKESFERNSNPKWLSMTLHELGNVEAYRKNGFSAAMYFCKAAALKLAAKDEYSFAITLAAINRLVRVFPETMNLPEIQMFMSNPK